MRQRDLLLRLGSIKPLQNKALSVIEGVRRMLKVRYNDVVEVAKLVRVGESRRATDIVDIQARQVHRPLGALEKRVDQAAVLLRRNEQLPLRRVGGKQLLHQGGRTRPRQLDADVGFVLIRALYEDVLKYRCTPSATNRVRLDSPEPRVDKRAFAASED